MSGRVRKLFAQVEELTRRDPTYKPDSIYDLGILLVLLIDLAWLVGGHLL